MRPMEYDLDSGDLDIEDLGTEDLSVDDLAIEGLRVEDLDVDLDDLDEEGMEEYLKLLGQDGGVPDMTSSLPEYNPSLLVKCARGCGYFGIEELNVLGRSGMHVTFRCPSCNTLQNSDVIFSE